MFVCLRVCFYIYFVSCNRPFAPKEKCYRKEHIIVIIIIIIITTTTTTTTPAAAAATAATTLLEKYCVGVK